MLRHDPRDWQNSHLEDIKAADQIQSPDSRQVPHGDIDDFIFAGENWMPSER